jgi:glycosyltransferase involved in cell wall biosynthesis
LVSRQGREVERLEALSIFLPMHNERENIDEAVQRACAALQRFAERGEVILVDDGSTDGTSARADELAASHPEVRVVHHEANRGYGAALQSGIRASRLPWIFYTDGDNQFDLDELALLLPLRHDHGIVTGYRIRRQDPWPRRLNGLVFNLAVGLLFGVRVRDVDCAFKLYRAEIFDGMPLVSSGAMIDLEIMARARRRGHRIAEVGVHHYPRRYGASSGGSVRVILRAARELGRLFKELQLAPRS